MSSFTQDFDIFNDTDPGITFSTDDQSWTISPGVLVSSSGRDGVLSNFNTSALFNSGTILSSGSDFRAGVRFNGNDSSIVNAVNARIIGAGTGVIVDGVGATIQNHGGILGLSGQGVDFGDESSRVTLANFGAIYGRDSGVRAFSLVDGGVIHNFGAITSNFDGINVETDDGLTTAITNAKGALIRGPDAAIVESRGRITLDNHGTVKGAVACFGIDNDVIANHGNITGFTFLGDGNDLFNGAGGISGPVYGGDGNDRLIGGTGKDLLDGGLGFDTLIGGRGSDQFIFETNIGPTPNIDRITDFAIGVDKIALLAGVFPHLGPDGFLGAAHFHVGAAAADASDRIIYNPANGFLFYDTDGKGGLGEIHFATLAPHLALHNTDLFVYHVVG